MHITHIPTENKKAKSGKAPYDVCMHHDGPCILRFTPNTAHIFDGWQNVRIRHNNEMPEYVISRFIRRAMCIQRELKSKRVITELEHVDLIKKYNKNDFDEDERGPDEDAD